jgi:hypothetical protein
VSNRTTYARAASSYDEECALVEAITEAIAKTSMVSDADVLVMRTGETAAALVDVLAMTLALSPAVHRSPRAIRKLTDEIRRRLLRHVASAKADADEFRKRCFTSTDVGGRA